MALSLGRDERDRVFDFAQCTSLIDLFDKIACALPDKLAVVDAAGSLTYAMLQARSEAIAESLTAAGVGASDLVGLHVDRSVGTVAAILGILRSGAAYVPLDTSNPAERIEYMLQDCGAAFELDAGTAALTKRCEQSPHRTANDLGGLDVAYVAYTSGSTGRPKGCIITHENVISFLAGSLPCFDLTCDDRWTVFHSLSFDASVWELWGALATGATAYLVPSAATLNPSVFSEMVRRDRITITSLVSSFFKFYLDVLIRREAEHASIRYMFFVGEAIRLDLVRDFIGLRADPKVTCVNMYGPTETTVFASFKVISQTDANRGPLSPIGRPFLNSTMTIRTESGELVTAGEVGEIVIGGGTVGVGYLNRESQTRSSFPIIDATRHYRTGDLGRELETGGFEFLGRIDQQIKRRGFRIEIEEIEHVLRQVQCVEDVVISMCAVGAAEFLVASVVAYESAGAGEAEQLLRAKAIGALHPVMRPDRYVFVSDFPRNASGKLDRRAVQLIASDKIAKVRA